MQAVKGVDAQKAAEEEVQFARQLAEAAYLEVENAKVDAAQVSAVLSKHRHADDAIFDEYDGCPEE